MPERKRFFLIDLFPKICGDIWWHTNISSAVEGGALHLIKLGSIITAPTAIWSHIYIQGAFFNYFAQISVLKRKTLFNQRGSFLHWEFHEHTKGLYKKYISKFENTQYFRTSTFDNVFKNRKQRLSNISRTAKYGIRWKSGSRPIYLDCQLSLLS